MVARENPFYGKQRNDILISRPVMYKVETKHGLGDKLNQIMDKLTDLKSISYTEDAVTGHFIVRLEGYVIVLRNDPESGRIFLLTAYPVGDEFGGNPL
jgi:hypothetical protein